MKPQCLLLVEEGLRDASGHWHVYNGCIADEFRSRGYEVEIAAGKTLAPDLAAQLSATPVFSLNRWSGYDALPPLRRRIRAVTHNLRFYRELSHFLENCPPFDITFAGNVALTHALGWLLAAQRHPDRLGKLVLMFVQDAGWYPNGETRPRFPPQARVLGALLKRFAPLVRSGKVVLTAETEVTAAQYQLLTGLPFHKLPHATQLLPGSRAAAAVGSPPVLVAPGFARYEKGSHILQEAWKRFREREPELPARLIMQWKADGSFKLPDGSTENRKLEEDPTVQYLDAALESQGLVDLLAGADGVVLPYLRSSYHSRISRVVIEAMQMGLPVLCTADTSLERCIHRHGSGRVVEGSDPERWARALAEFLEELPQLKEKAQKSAPNAEKAYSPATFADILISLCE